MTTVETRVEVKVRSQRGGSGLGPGKDMAIASGMLTVPVSNGEVPLAPQQIGSDDLEELSRLIREVNWNEVRQSYTPRIGSGEDRVTVGGWHDVYINESGAEDVPASLRAVLAETKVLYERYRPPPWPPTVVLPREALGARGFVTLVFVGGQGGMWPALSVGDSGDYTVKGRPNFQERTGRVSPATVARLHWEVNAVPWPKLQRLYTTGCGDCGDQHVIVSIAWTWYRSGVALSATKVPASLRVLLADLEGLYERLGGH